MKRGGATAILVLAAMLVLTACATPPPAEQPELTAVKTSASELYSDVTKLTIPHRAFAHIKRAAGDLYVVVDSGVGYLDTLVRIDPETSEEEVVLTSDNDIAWLVASDRWLVWETNMHMYAQPVGGGERIQLGTLQEVYAPDIEGDTVAWMNRLENGTYQVTVRNLTEDNNRVLADLVLPCFYNNFIDLQDGAVLWTDVIDGAGRYRRCSVTGGPIEDFPVTGEEYHIPGYACMYGDRFFSINFKNYYEWTWSEQKLGYFDIQNGEFTAVEYPGLYSNGMRLRGGTLAVLDQEQNLHLYDASDPEVTVDMSDVIGTLQDAIGTVDDETFWCGIYEEPSPGRGCTVYLITVP